MDIFKLVFATVAVVALIGCGTEKDQRRATENDKKEFNRNMDIFKTIAGTPGELPSEDATEQDFKNMNAERLTHYKANLEKFCKATDTLLTIDARKRIRIVNKHTGKPMRSTFENILSIYSNQLKMVNARLSALNPKPPATPQRRQGKK